MVARRTAAKRGADVIYGYLRRLVEDEVMTLVTKS
jgi:hypothetical protein